MDQWKRTLLTATVLIALASVVYAVKYTTTLTYFNIATVESFTVTLPGQGAVTATTGGASTTNIEFNSTDGTDNCVDPCIASSVTCQEAGTAIFVISNTGTVALDMSANFSASPPSCVKVGGSNTSRAAACTGAIIDTTPVTIIADLGPGLTANYWEAANFTACTSGDTTSKLQSVGGVQSS
ncbi:MAG: hypothetical protein Sv326_1218 [Candidatus Fermentimicrarchaeum limneticum]|uniref:Uncharacterized protein n=1 Tax=Fermentimicrarchaeum limneticum TaxID=2795018 RepID=A0A7D5XFT5_FERL1|nr:MAG: hypothetical protein Sv326_1218 [Candidatus Fermentimicrarchaeum limneticum]